MYFPYFRGRQNELLCLRELLDAGILSDKIVPIIEPVRFSSTLFSTLAKFTEMNRRIIVVANPKVGSFNKEYVEMKKKMDREGDKQKREKIQRILSNYLAIWENSNIQKAYIVDKTIITEIINRKKRAEDLVLINFETGNYRFYEEYGKVLSAKYTLIPKDEDFKDEVYGDTVVLEDGYIKAKRNIDYIVSPDDFFSRNHLVYKKRGYSGFSDFSMVGNEFEENGFAPLAIAIHIMYFGNKDELRVHHFVSESNDSISDPARKFEEAMSNLLKWEYLYRVPKTKGLTSLIECYNLGKFPGLGVIKKYSMMHHIEMMGDYLDNMK